MRLFKILSVAYAMLLPLPFSLANASEVKVGYIVPNSPAEKSGIRINDIILKVGNYEIKSSADVIRAISENGIKKAINISLKRGKKITRLKVKPTDIRNLSNQ